MQADFAVIGGGVVGLSIAHGLLKQGKTVVCIDGTDADFRASRGNFGLVWIQSKGIGHAPYAAWTQKAVRRYRGFVDQLQADTGIEVSYQQTGGYEYFVDDAALQARAASFEQLKQDLGGDYPFEVFDRERIKQEEPAVGPLVCGATFYPEDGHINPLQLLHALAHACVDLGFVHLTGRKVVAATQGDAGFSLTLDNQQTVRAERVVVAAGLGAKVVGPMFGFRGLVVPQRGQVLVTEKLPKLVNRPSLTVRQVNEGAIQIGDSKEDVGYDDSETVPTTASIAARAIKVIPALKSARLVRTWAALRVMSPDGLPIYQKSTQYPGAALVTCHSGISLAAAHSELLSSWLLDQPTAPDLAYFSEDRF